MTGTKTGHIGTILRVEGSQKGPKTFEKNQRGIQRRADLPREARRKGKPGAGSLANSEYTALNPFWERWDVS